MSANASREPRRSSATCRSPWPPTSNPSDTSDRASAQEIRGRSPSPRFGRRLGAVADPRRARLRPHLPAPPSVRQGAQRQPDAFQARKSAGIGRAFSNVLWGPLVEEKAEPGRKAPDDPGQAFGMIHRNLGQIGPEPDSVPEND